MQTFLPYPSAWDSARALDDARLRKQGQEGLQIVKVLLGLQDGYRHHPAVTMWAGHEAALGWYITEIGRECERRGFSRAFDTEAFGLLYRAEKMVVRLPWWWGSMAFHVSHQSNLIRKDPAYYAPQFPFAPLDAAYLWPKDRGEMALSKPDRKRVETGERVAWGV